MANQTGLNMVTDAALLAGIIGQGMTLTAGDSSLMFRLFNDMIEEWDTSRYLIFSMLTMGVSADGRTTPYLIGPGAADFPVARRPDRLEGAFVRQVFSGGLPVDTPLIVWQAIEDYNLNSLKAKFLSYPSGVYLDTAFPIGGISIYPWPNGGGLYQIFLTFKNVLPQFTAVSDMGTIPGQYRSAIKFNLARRYREAYGKAEKPSLTKKAIATLNTLRNSNLQVPNLGMPVGLAGRGIYNIYSDGRHA